MGTSLWLKLEDATALALPDRTPVSSIAEYYGWHAGVIGARKIARVWVAAQPAPPAYVNHGRWLVDCRACGGGAFTHPDWRIACCGNCGAVYRDVPFPAELDEITRLLLERPRRENQNWTPGEPLWQLKAENLLHRLAS